LCFIGGENTAQIFFDFVLAIGSVFFATLFVVLDRRKQFDVVGICSKFFRKFMLGTVIEKT